ncbi:DUF4192 domain-containing protein [Rhodococcus sp. Q]|uniref:DUF4192 domain-containing protein n=1 Tax=Rhodococcus sp. Q TaxID=2502252 RepID=UPI0014853746|nr:DUF4192 domain-containing protein [Rhodococcus sp. Q]
MNSPIRISTPSDMIAAIPALLGFYPTQSVVGIVLSGGQIATVIRVDAGDNDPERSATAAKFVGMTPTAEAVLLVAVADARAAGAALKTLDAIRDALDTEGIITPRPLYIPKIEAGMHWTNLDGNENGVCADPMASTVHTARVVDGLVVESSRDNMVATYRQGRTVETGDMREAMATAHKEGSDQFAQNVLTELVAAARDGRTPDVALAARVGILFPLHVVARDAALGLALSDPMNAHRVMAAIANQLDGIARAEALTVAGYFAYAAGRGPLAGIAFNTAYDAIRGYPANPPRLLDLLHRALTSGVHQDQILELARTGRTQAQNLGVELPEASDA